MKIVDPKEVCPECKQTHCKHYESDFDRYLVEQNVGIEDKPVIQQ